MKINNSRGFSAVEALLIIALIGLLGGAGYYVYNQNQTEETTEPATNIQQPAASSTVETQEEGDNKSIFPFTYSVPKDWKSEDTTEQQNNYKSVRLTAPNTKIDSEGYENVISGAEINIYGDKESKYSNLETFLKNDALYTDYGKDKKAAKIDGVDAMNYTWRYEGPPKHILVFIHGGKSYTIQMQKSVYDKPEYKKAFQDFASSIKFNQQ